MPATIGVSMIRAHRVDPDSPGGIFESSAFGQPEYPVFGCAIHSPTGDAHESADRRAVDDGAASLFAHQEQLVLHAAPDAAQIDGEHAIKVLGAGVSCLRKGALHAGIVERRIQLSETEDGLLDHRCHLSLIRDIATDANRLMAGRDQIVRGGMNRSLIDIR
jgi:hypothetical protein